MGSPELESGIFAMSRRRSQKRYRAAVFFCYKTEWMRRITILLRKKEAFKIFIFSFFKNLYV